MSAEAPVVVVRELEHKNFIGGAAVVAAHISALGASCDFISVVGNDDTAELVNNQLALQGIGNALSTDHSRPTTFKKRYVVENQKLFESVDLKHNLDTEIEDQVIAKLFDLAPHSTGIVQSQTSCAGCYRSSKAVKKSQLSTNYSYLGIFSAAVKSDQ